MRPTASLFAKILTWFFLNMVLVAAALIVFFIFQQDINLQALLGRQGVDRIRATGMLIVHDLNQAPQKTWPDILARHAAVHQVDFAVLFHNGRLYSSFDEKVPGKVRMKARELLPRRPPKGQMMRQELMGGPQHRSTRRRHIEPDIRHQNQSPREKRFIRPEGYGTNPYFRMRTRHPTRYWAGLRIPLSPDSTRPIEAAMLLTVSDTFTGNGFFFDPLPWIIVTLEVLLISVILWIPMVRHITRPLSRMTHATEKIAEGNFNVTIHEPRRDEIGRLAKAINHMTSRLSALVKGQKRFLGDVAHELGSPLARLQMGLGALEQRVQAESKERVRNVIEDVDHLSKLVSELLAFSRADIKSSTVKLKSVTLLSLVQTAVERERTLSNEIMIDINADIRVHASAELLTRALSNLIRNAIKYAASYGSIEVIANKNKDKVVIEVRDQGPGVPQDQIDQLFEPFFRPQSSRDRDSGGVGLGLAIVKTCVETCKGTVSAANLDPNGFVVTITLNAKD